jgi:gliding motility-associated-like protein
LIPFSPIQKLIRPAVQLAVAACLSVSASVHAQTETFGMYVAPNGSFQVNGNATISIFSNVNNKGAFGASKGTTVNFFGDRWRNSNTAIMPDEWGYNNPDAFTGVGGVFRFAGQFPQYITGGFSVTGKNGPAFPNLSIANARGVYLDENNDAAIRGTLVFENGLFWLNDNNLQLGITKPGSFAGYNENRFVATGNTVRGGFLYAAQVSGSTGRLILPIGPQAGSYAPVSLLFNATKAQDIRARVYDNIYSNAIQGTTGSPASVQQTWILGQSDTTPVASLVALQHINVREGAAYTTHRGNSFVSMYDFNTRKWDTLRPSGFITPGIYTTSTLVPGTYINARSFTTLGQNLYLTKTTDTRTDSITLSKAALTPQRQPDGSFLVGFRFLLRNTGALVASNLSLTDSLDVIIPPPAQFSVVSAQASGQLAINPKFDGTTDRNLLLPTSTLAPFTTDSVTLTLNINPNSRDGFYYNKAFIKGDMTGFGGNVYTFSNGSVNGLTPAAPAAAPTPTPFILSPAKYQIPEGFSPNGDGINDKFIIGSLGTSIAEVWIFDKFGNYVYHSANYKNDWTGIGNQGRQYVNQPVPDGTYFYKITITDPASGNKENFAGYISIWR